MRLDACALDQYMPWIICWRQTPVLEWACSAFCLPFTIYTSATFSAATHCIVVQLAPVPLLRSLWTLAEATLTACLGKVDHEAALPHRDALHGDNARHDAICQAYHRTLCGHKGPVRVVTMEGAVSGWYCSAAGMGMVKTAKIWRGLHAREGRGGQHVSSGASLCSTVNSLLLDTQLSSVEQ